MRKILVLCGSLFLAGCLTESPEELDRLVKEDPAFKQMISSRDEAHHQIRLIKEELLSKKKVLDGQLSKLREEYDVYAKEQNKKIDQYRSTIETKRAQIKKEIEAASASLSAKSDELAGYQRTLEDVKKVLTEGKGIRLSKAERLKWEERVLLLSEKMRPLAEDIQELKVQIRLKKQKAGYLR